MKRILGILLVAGALVLGYLGYTRMDDSSAEVKIGDLEISASDKSSKQSAYIYFGLGVVALLAGLTLMQSKR